MVTPLRIPGFAAVFSEPGPRFRDLCVGKSEQNRVGRCNRTHAGRWRPEAVKGQFLTLVVYDDVAYVFGLVSLG